MFQALFFILVFLILPKVAWPSAKLSSLWMVVAIAMAVYQYLNPPFSLLDAMSMSYDTPAFQLRYGFRDFMMDNFDDWSESGPASTDPESLYYEQLYGRLRSKASRKAYALAGHSAFVDCGWCMDTPDFVYFSLPRIAMDYVYFLLAVGVLTIPRYGQARLYAFVTALCGFAFEAYMLIYQDIPGIQELSNSDMPATVLFKSRWAMFAVFLVLLWLTNGKNRGQGEQLNTIQSSLTAAVQLLPVARALESSITSNPTLRKRKLAHADHQMQSISVATHQKENYAEFRRVLLEKIPMQPFQTSIACVRRIFQQAVAVGHLSPYPSEQVAVNEFKQTLFLYPSPEELKQQ
jgi:hypothetical protein